ncbi:MAG: phosphotransferase, partial [Anaerolineae bacterium]
MKIEPNLDPSALKGVLRESYGIEPAAGEDPAALAFVPTGWISACYAVGARRGRYFLKLQPLTGPQASAASSPDFYLPLTRQLHDTGILPHIAYPIPTVDGRLWTTWEGWRVIVQNYIDGEVVGHGGMTPAVITELGALVGRLHRAAPRLDLPVAFREAFDIAFEDELVADLEALAALGPEATPGQQGLADLLVPRREEILGYLHRLQALEFSPVRGELEGGVRARTGAGSADPPCIPVPQTAPG